MRSCIILCGGLSKRMGRDKGSMKIQNKPLINHILEALNGQIDEVVIVLNDDNRIKKYKKFIIQKNYSYKIYFTTDEDKNVGPIGGVKTGLKHINSDYGLVLPCDSPYIENDFVYYMFDTLEALLEDEENKDLKALVPYHRSPNDVNIIKRAEPLHTILKKDLLPIIDELIEANIHRVRLIMKNQKCFFIPIDNHLIYDTNFKNINRPSDLEE